MLGRASFPPPRRNAAINLRAGAARPASLIVALGSRRSWLNPVPGAGIRPQDASRVPSPTCRTKKKLEETRWINRVEPISFRNAVQHSAKYPTYPGCCVPPAHERRTIQIGRITKERLFGARAPRDAQTARERDERTARAGLNRTTDAQCLADRSSRGSVRRGRENTSEALPL